MPTPGSCQVREDAGRRDRLVLPLRLPSAVVAATGACPPEEGRFTGSASALTTGVLSPAHASSSASTRFQDFSETTGAVLGMKGRALDHQFGQPHAHVVPEKLQAVILDAVNPFGKGGVRIGQAPLPHEIGHQAERVYHGAHVGPAALQDQLGCRPVGRELGIGRC
jgi:hypothetical protein